MANRGHEDSPELRGRSTGSASRPGVSRRPDTSSQVKRISNGGSPSPRGNNGRVEHISYKPIGSSNNEPDLDASFVYLPPAPGSAGLGTGELLLHHMSRGTLGYGAFDQGSGGFLETVKHVSALVDIAEGRTPVIGDRTDDGVALCPACIERVASAVESDTERLQRESQAYVDAVTAEEDRQRQIRKALSINVGITGGDANGGEPARQLSDDELVCSAIENFQEEIAGLTAACAEYQQEYVNLTALLAEQSMRAADLSREEDLLFMDKNDLEIDAREFENVSRQLASQCADAHREVAALSSVELHSALFQLIVDERGLRYPLINDMRLAYRPKGDLGWPEINCAWASAAQLLMFVGGAVKFTSRDLRVVPMTTCAKIIEVSSNRRVVYNLGREFDGADHRYGSGKRHSRGSESMVPSLRAFNALLHELLQHIHSLSASQVKKRAISWGQPPFEMARSRIGSHDLLRLHEKDDSAGWSAVIHCMASNLSWLSHNAGHFVNT